MFFTLVDINGNNTGDAADEVVSESWSDGAGRGKQLSRRKKGRCEASFQDGADYKIRTCDPTRVKRVLYR